MNSLEQSLISVSPLQIINNQARQSADTDREGTTISTYQLTPKQSLPLACCLHYALQLRATELRQALKVKGKGRQGILNIV